jgi:DNA processing protein
MAEKQLSLLTKQESGDLKLWYSGDLNVLRRPSVAVVGAREVSSEGASRARRVAKELAQAGVCVVSGLAAGVDFHALSSAIDAGGRVAAVIGTGISKAYPAANARLQETIYRDHLLISQFADGARVFQSNFPQRNRTMAAISHGTLIVEASNTSGSLSQAAECTRLGRWLFVLRSLVNNPAIDWPQKFSTYERFVVVDSVDDVINRVRETCSS